MGGIDETEEYPLEGEGDDSVQEATGNTIVLDKSSASIVNLRRTIYLTMMSSVDFEEAGHKMLKITLSPGQEIEMVTMIIECCSQEKTYIKYFGLLAQRFCFLNRIYQELFEHCFEKQFMLVHRLETNKLRNVSKMFAHLLGTDAISWGVLQCIRLTMEETNSSGRIFIKIIFQELAENIGIKKINERINNRTFTHWFSSILPKDTLSNVRFSINFFTSIGLGGLTDSQRDYLDHLPNLITKRQKKELKQSENQKVPRLEIGVSSYTEYESTSNIHSSTTELDSELTSSK